jgi:hypothetical protein
MKIIACRNLLEAQLAKTSSSALEMTPLGRAAGTVLEMVHAYKSDGDTFFARGDSVNALASYWYGFGWLHFGCSYGLLLVPQTDEHSCPFVGPCETLPQPFRAKLEGKTTRYAYLIDAARSSVASAPDAGTEIFECAERVLLITATYSSAGHRYLETGILEDALACFSYGHGWLDAAVRAGLFRITAERDLFTV